MTSDPLRNDSTRAHGAAVDSLERDAKIDHLLLLGLEHYFQGDYEQAINVWTRVLFLDRAHARARAYIDRARSALAERQRQAEELAWAGAPGVRAESVVLPPVAPMPAVRAAAAERPVPRADGWWSWRRGSMAVAALALVAGAGYTAYSKSRLPDWLRPALPRSLSATSARAVVRDALPSPPSRGEMALARARMLFASGDLRDALSALDRVRSTDPQRSDADQLRALIQRQLLDLTRR
jgi:tetratricopeptide (TPR) repeat protein